MVHKLKTKADGSLQKNKARYVAKRLKPIEGIDYFDTFVPMSKPETFRLFLCLAAKKIHVERDRCKVSLHASQNEGRIVR